MSARTLSKWSSLLVSWAAPMLWIGGLPALAAAQSTPATAALEYIAPAGCPERSDWLGAIHARLADGRLGASAASGVPAARVTIEASGTEARITFGAGGLERRIVGADCDEVASAAALIVAVALGVGPDSAPPAPETAAAPAPLASPAQDRAPPQAPVLAQSGAAPLPLAAIDARIDEPAASDPAVGGRRWSVDLGASAETNSWLGAWPAAMWGASVELVSPSRGWSARAAGEYGTSEPSSRGRRAELSYWGGHLDLCPLALGARRAWRWLNCAEVHVGMLQARGDESSELATALSQRALLATAVAVTRLQTPPLWAFRLEFEAGLAVPLLRQTFQFEAPEEVIVQSPVVGFIGRAGLRIPLDGQLD